MCIYACVQTLSTPQILPPHQKLIVEIALFAPSRLFFINSELPVAQRFQAFPRAARLPVEFALLVAQLLQPRQFALQFFPVALQFGFAQQIEPQLGGCDAAAEVTGFSRRKFLAARLHLFEQMPYARHLLVGGAQPQLLLTLDAFAEMKHRLERKLEGHFPIPAMP